MRLFVRSILTHFPTWQYISVEGWRFGPELIRHLRRDGWLIFGTFREPVERAISAYDYEIRWHGIATVPEVNRTYTKSRSISDWVSTEFGAAHSLQQSERKLWECCCDCLTGWWGTSSAQTTLSKVVLPEVLENLYTGPATLAKAIESVYEFDYLVEVGSRAKGMVESIKELVGAFDLPATSGQAQHGMTLVTSWSAEWNVLSKHRLPYNVTREEWKLLELHNGNDSVVYHIAADEWAVKHCEAG
jgi:hypothetical protein